MTVKGERLLRVPCCYQGGKQRVASKLVDEILGTYPAVAEDDALFYDLCCGSGAVTIELLNRGVKPENIVMLDISSWGAFWKSIGSGSFDFGYFDSVLNDIPSDKSKVKAFMENLANRPIEGREAEVYPILQSCSFGGKQIWRNGEAWGNAFFRDYWLPKPGSVRKSPANPMQPAADTLRSRIVDLVSACRGLTCLHEDIHAVLEMGLSRRAVVYVDPPYGQTTGYAYGFDLAEFVEEFTKRHRVPLFVSEAKPLTENSKRLDFSGAKGGISGARVGRHQEWLTLFS